MESITGKYTVCLLFTKDLKRILLCRKKKTAYKNLLNGVGGECLPDETPTDCAIREIREETEITNVRNLTWIGTIGLPYDCKHNRMNPDPSNPACTLYFYTGIIPDGYTVPENTDEPLFLIEIEDAMKTEMLAGDGDLKYFIPIAKIRLEQQIQI